MKVSHERMKDSTRLCFFVLPLQPSKRLHIDSAVPLIVEQLPLYYSCPCANICTNEDINACLLYIFILLYFKTIINYKR